MTTTELRDLLARATPGPWDSTIYCKRDGSPIKTVDDIKETVAGSADYSARTELFGVTLQDADENGLSTVVCYTGNGPNAHNNAALIALAPTLAAELIEARAEIERKGGVIQEAHDLISKQRDAITALTAERDALRAAAGLTRWQKQSGGCQMSDLKSCPFCGYKAFVSPENASDGNYSVECLNSDCQATFATCFASRDLAIVAWNTRPAAPAQEDDVKRVKNAIRAVMPEMFGSPETLADPARVERFNRASDQMAEKYSRAAIRALKRGEG